MTEEANKARDVERANVLINNEGQFDPAELREALENRICPFCGAGPFQIVLRHISSMHGIFRREMREMAEITWKKSLLPDDLYQRKSIWGKLNKMEERLGDRSHWKLDPSERTVQHFSKAGKATKREAMKKMLEAQGAEGLKESAKRLNATNAAKSPEEKRKVAQKARETRLANSPTKRKPGVTHVKSTPERRRAVSKKARAAWQAQLAAMSAEDRNAYYRHLQQGRQKSAVESGETVGLDGLVDLVTRWRVAAASGAVKRSLCSKLAQEDGVTMLTIRNRLGKAVGLGLIAQSELPAWKGQRYLQIIDFHTDERHRLPGDNSF